MITVILMLILIVWLIVDHLKVMKELRAIQHGAHLNENRSQNRGIMVKGTTN